MTPEERLQFADLMHPALIALVQRSGGEVTIDSIEYFQAEQLWLNVHRIQNSDGSLLMRLTVTESEEPKAGMD